MTDIKHLFDTVMSEIQSTGSAWHESDYKSIKELEIDGRGRFGEALIERIITTLGYDAESNGATDRTKKHWDIRDNSNGLDIEVKTATLGNKKTFQFEGFEKDRDYHAVILLGIAPSALYLTIAKKAEMPFNKPNDLFTVNPKKMHRRGHGIQYKWTLSENDCKGREIKTLDDFKAMYERIRGNG